MAARTSDLKSGIRGGSSRSETLKPGRKTIKDGTGNPRGEGVEPLPRPAVVSPYDTGDWKLTLRIARFLAVFLTAMALIPAGAHLFALVNKIGMPKEQYFAVQAIYRGWALLGAVLIAAILADAIFAAMLRGQGAPVLFAGGAAAALLASLAVFFLFVFPANQATANWTVAPDDWRSLRLNWEYGHATGAALDFVALICVILAS
jgi:hypothetical protein